MKFIALGFPLDVGQRSSWQRKVQHSFDCCSNRNLLFVQVQGSRDRKKAIHGDENLREICNTSSRYSIFNSRDMWIKKKKKSNAPIGLYIYLFSSKNCKHHEEIVESSLFYHAATFIIYTVVMSSRHFVRNTWQWEGSQISDELVWIVLSNPE